MVSVEETNMSEPEPIPPGVEDSRRLELALVRFQRNVALVCIGAILVFVFIFSRV
jgi:hypothetical protein